MKTYYRGNLPHIQPVGAGFFITFRLKDSLPKETLKKISHDYYQKLNQLQLIKDNHQRIYEIFLLRKNYLKKWDEMLDKIKSGPHYLTDSHLKKIISQELKKHDGTLYHLLAYCIMSNHVHLVLDLGIQLENIEKEEDLYQKYIPLDKILKQIKGSTARYANIHLGRTGQFWERESFDTYIRNEKMLNNVISYTLENPVRAGIVKSWEDFDGAFIAGISDQ